MSEHKGEEMKGRLKEAVGDVTGDKVKDIIDPKP
jgi:uncharacterized protein YjbJ (UPF0337 family)